MAQLARDARELGRLIAQGRRARGLSQAGLARTLGVGRNTVTRLESGDLQAIKRLMAVVNALDILLIVADPEETGP